MNIKNIPLLTGIILLATGLIGILFNQFSVFWMWLLVLLGITVIVWIVVVSKKDKDFEKK